MVTKPGGNEVLLIHQLGNRRNLQLEEESKTSSCQSLESEQKNGSQEGCGRVYPHTTSWQCCVEFVLGDYWWPVNNTVGDGPLCVDDDINMTVNWAWSRRPSSERGLIGASAGSVVPTVT